MRGLALAELDTAQDDELKQLLARHGVLVLHDQPVDDGAFVAFLRSFGALVFTKGETAVDGHPDLNVVTNVGRATPPRSTFHVDTTTSGARPRTRRCVR